MNKIQELLKNLDNSFEDFNEHIDLLITLGRANKLANFPNHILLLENSLFKLKLRIKDIKSEVTSVNAEYALHSMHASENVNDAWLMQLLDGKLILKGSEPEDVLLMEEYLQAKNKQ